MESIKEQSKTKKIIKKRIPIEELKRKPIIEEQPNENQQQPIDSSDVCILK